MAEHTWLLRARWAAVDAACAAVRDGMVVGLGSGVTASLAVERLGRWLRSGKLTRLQGIATSRATAALARSWSIPLTSLDRQPRIDLTIDGADEVDPALRLSKGRGGALLYEKIVARASTTLLIVVDESKLVSELGASGPVSVEIVPFGWRLHLAALERLGGRAALREREGAPIRTDAGNCSADCHFGPIADPAALERELKLTPGVVESGLFVGLATRVFVGRRDGSVQALDAR